MRIRTQLIVTMLLFGIVLAAISVSAIITNQRVEKANEQDKIAGSIVQGASELSYLSNDYVIYRESQQLERWQTRFASFSSDVARLQTDEPEQQALVRNIEANTRRLKDVFDSVVAAVGSSSQNQGETNDPALLRVSWSRIAVQSQGLVSDASRLSQLLGNQVEELQRTNTIFVVALVGVFGAYFLVNYLIIQRRALKSIATLHAGTAVIGSGNLDFRIEEKRNDEIADLSRAFNRMAADLKTVTASKTDLEREIDERKRAEAVISHLASFPELNPNPVVELDAAGKIVYLNPAARSEFPGLSMERIQHPFLADWEKLASALLKGEARSVTRDINVGDRWYDQGVAYLPSIQRFRIYTRDVTQRKGAEEALSRRTAELEAANRELEAFSYSVSHDLRAPLRIMEGFSSALLEDYAAKLDDQGKQYLRYIQDSSDLMARLIDDLLKLSRVTRSDMNREKVNLSEIAQKIVAGLEKAEPGQKVKLNIASDVMAYGDRNLLHLVLENLLGNAWKFSGKVDSPRIEMGIAEYNGKRAYFVRDNGVGFDMTYADKLFKPFQRLHKASEFAGTGIGLATVQRIIRRHGGEVWAESKLGEGATFYFTLN